MRGKKLSLTSEKAVLLYIAAATVIVHLLAGSYGYFIDELYTLACSRHLSFGFVDIPPIAPALLALNTLVFGDSLTAIHILPSIMCGAMVIAVGMMAKELGGGRKAVIFAGLCAALVPVWIIDGTLFTYDFLDQFTIMMLFYLMIRLLKRENPKIWLWIGLTAGLGVMVKPSMLFYIMGVAIALLLTKHRKQYLTKWPWLGAAIAIVIITPSLVWQILHDFPIAKYWAQYSEIRSKHYGPGQFILEQIITSNLILFPVWVTGLMSFFFGKGRRFRLLGIVYCVLIVVFILIGSSEYMPTPLYAMLLAGGAVAIERFASEKRLRRILVAAYTCVIVAVSAIQAPLFLPILPIDDLVRYNSTVGNVFGGDQSRQIDALPLYIYYRFDWETAVADVAEVYQSLPPSEQADATIYASGYGFAGALDLLGKEYGLPDAFCTLFNYYYFSGDNARDGTWITVHMPYEFLKSEFGEVKHAKTSASKYRQPHRIDIYVCRYPKYGIQKIKEDIRAYIEGQ